MSIKGIIDVLAVVWFLLFSYLTALGLVFGSITSGDKIALLTPLALLPAIAWIAWRVYRHEGYFVEPTAKQTIFLGGLIGLLAVSQYFNVAEALSKFL